MKTKNQVTFIVRITLKGRNIPKFDGDEQGELAESFQQATYDYLMLAMDDENTDVDVSVKEEKIP